MPRRLTARSALLLVVLALIVSPARADYLFWVEAGEDAIQRSNTDGSDTVTLAHFVMESAQHLAIDAAARKVYWADRSRNQLARADLDGGTNPEVLLSTPLPSYIALDTVNGKIYWTAQTLHTLSRANLDGSSPESLYGDLPEPTGVAVDPSTGRLFWADATAEAVLATGLGGGAVDTLASGLYNPLSLAVHPGHGWIFWTEDGTERVVRTDEDGANLVVLASNQGFFNLRDIAVDTTADRLFFVSDYIAGRMYRMNLDGSDLTQVINGENYGPWGVAADPVTGTFTWWHNGDRAFYRTDPLVGGKTLTHAYMGTPSDLERDPEAGVLFWADGAHIFRVNEDGSDFRRVTSDFSGTAEAIALDTDANLLYWVTNSSLYRADYEGASVQDLNPSCVPSFPTGLALDAANGKLYWTAGAALQRSNLDGTGCETLNIAGLTNPDALAMDSATGLLYIADSSAYEIFRYDVNSSQLTPLATAGSTLLGIALGPGDGKLYWSQGLYQILRANLSDGGNVEPVIPLANGPRGVATAAHATAVAPSSMSAIRGRY